MLRRGRSADLRRRAEVRIKVRRMYPAGKRSSGAEQRSGTLGPKSWADVVANRMRRGIRRLGQVFERI